MHHSTARSTQTHAADDERTALKRMQLRIVPQILHAATREKKRTASPHATRVSVFVLFVPVKQNKLSTCTRHTLASPYASVEPSADTHALRTSPAATLSAWLACKEESEKREREARQAGGTQVYLQESERRVCRYSVCWQEKVCSVLAREQEARESAGTQFACFTSCASTASTLSVAREARGSPLVSICACCTSKTSAFVLCTSKASKVSTCRLASRALERGRGASLRSRSTLPVKQVI
jgi:hypothetical protein